MTLYSTNNSRHQVSLAEAVMRGLPPDNGLYMPSRIAPLPPQFIQNLPYFSFPEIAYRVASNLLDGAIPEEDLWDLIQQAINFPAPVVPIQPGIFCLELFHGPSLAFKDFGARFMAQLMSYFNRNQAEPLTILVATSGDTGGAVATGFYHTPGIRVVILYPAGGVSALQEKQLTTLGSNIHALEVRGSFDDCQAMVKAAFLDPVLNQSLRLSSANSINIARLIPQSFYYFEALRQLPEVLQGERPLAISVPSGNFGNLTAGLFAKKMGLPIGHFVAATNVNAVVPNYLNTGTYLPHPAIATLSNAMDVGNPSNFARMLDFFASPDCSTWNNMQQHLSGYSIDDEATRATIKKVFSGFNYLLDPHGAVGYLALAEYLSEHPNHVGLVLGTAHPAKFLETMEAILDHSIPIPPALAVLQDRPKQATLIEPDPAELKRWLLAHPR